MTYYVGNIPAVPTDIQHWGVLGMKWGIRRYQNPDGTLTAAGKARYGENGKYKYRSIGQKLSQRKTDKLKAKFQKQVDDAVIEKDKEGNVTANYGKLMKAQKTQDKWRKSQSKLNAYKKRDADRQKYAEKTSVKKAIGQKAGGLLTGFSDVGYQRDRSRGASRGKAFANQLLPALGGAAIAIAMNAVGNRKAMAFIEKNLFDKAASTATKYAVGGAAAGLATSFAARKAQVMNDNKRKYGHRLWT